VENHRCYGAVYLPLLLILAISPSRILAQEIDRSMDRPESEKTHEERERDQAIKDVFSGKRLMMPADAMMRETHRTIMTLNKDTPPATFVDFGKPDGLSNNYSLFGFSTRRIEFRNNYWNMPLIVHDLSANQTKECVNTRDLFVLSGYITPADEQWFRTNKLNYVIGSAFSPKQFQKEQVRAAALMVKPFRPDEVVVFDGLPHETGPASSRSELRRMGLPSSPKEWKAVRQDIYSAIGKMTTEIATKKSLEKELGSGSKNVLFLIAHSDSESIFLPGLHGGRLSMKELDQIHRDVAPNRAVVLLACKTGQVNGKTNSIAEIILKNKLAATVLATDGYIYATDLSDMLREFQSHGVLGRAFPELRPIVQLKIPAVVWKKDLIDSQGNAREATVQVLRDVGSSSGL